jgi:hypothetical protein
MFKDIRVQAAVQTFLIIAAGLAVLTGFTYLIQQLSSDVIWGWLFVFWSAFMINILYSTIKSKLEIKAAIEAHDDNLRAGDK